LELTKPHPPPVPGSLGISDRDERRPQ